MSLDPQWFTGDDFVMVHPDAVRHFDGDVLAVYVLARLRYRARAFGYDRDGHRWWRVAADVLADDLGLTVRRVRRVLNLLAARGDVVVAKHHERGNYDQTQSYALAYREIPGTADMTIPSHRRDVPVSSDVTGSSHHDVTIPSHLPIRSEEGKEQPSPLAPLAEPVDNFEEFWQAYPRRIGKAAARRAWAKVVLRGTPAAAVLAGARAYAASDLPDARWIPSPASWLDDGRWTDDLTTRPSVAAVGPGADRCTQPGHDSYSARNCAGCRADALIAGTGCA